MDHPTKTCVLSPLMVVLLTFLVAIATGCATHRVQDPLTPETPQLMAFNSYPIYVEVRSQHGDRVDVDVVPGNFNTNDGPVVLAASHDDWLTQGLRNAFRSAGFHIATEHTSQAPAIIASVKEFRGEQRSGFPLPLFGFVSSFDVTLRIPTSGQDVVFQRAFVATARQRSRGGTSNRNKEELIREALDEVFIEIVEETYDLLSTGR